MLGIYFTSFGNVINQLILPKAVKSVYENANPQNLTEEMTKVARISLILLLFVFGSFVVVGQDFVELWVGNTYENAYYIAVGVMLVYIMPIAQGYAHSILEAKKLLRFKTLSFLITSVIGMILGGLLSYPYEELGMIAGLIMPLFILQWGVMNYYYQKILQLKIGWFFEQTYPLFLVSAIIIPVGFLIAQQFETTWLNFIIKSIIFSVFFGVLIFFLMNKTEKKLFLKTLRK
jgi:O-antigen/teichoic acid export membrane protein